MAIETVSSGLGSQNSVEIIAPVTPKNVLSSSSTNDNADCEFSKKTDPRKCKNNEVDALFDHVNNDRCLPVGKNFIDHIFDKFDDLQAEYVKKDETPIDKVTSQLQCLASIEYTPPRKHKMIDTEETRSRRLLAASEGRKAFCEILENAGIDSNTYFVNSLSSKKKKNLKFECSTPIASCSQTPTSKRITTPLPLSGIRFLGSPLNISSSNNEFSSYMTPVSRSDFLPDTDVSQATENMKTILIGITCFVDARNDRDNCSEACKIELLKIGAKVEKNFTKKVTHVVFKEGRKSTYTKAKNLGIPIVSVIWIEACKLAKGPVDPSLYPPANLEKYEIETPISVILDRKIRRLLYGNKNKKALAGGSLRISPATMSIKKQCNKKKALTEMKDNNKTSEKNSNKDRQCTKKLNFIDIDEPKAIDDIDNSVMILDDNDENMSDSSEFAKLKMNSLPKRKSAPGALAKKRAVKIKKLNDYFENNNQNISKKRSRSKSPEEVKHELKKTKTNIQSEIKENLDKNGNTNINKKKKLYVPETSSILKEIQPETIAAAITPVISVKTMAPFVKKTVNKRLDMTDDSFSNSRSSISLFAQSVEKSTDAKPKPVPTIVFTSIRREDCDKLTLIVKKLGTFDIEERVSERTSHVVTNVLRRTLNLLKGLARGCWIVRDQWIHESDSTGKWLAEEHFELKSYSPAVTECRLQKQVFKKSFRMDLFSTFGPIYVSPQTVPPSHELIDLIKLCGGKIVICARGAKMIIGKKLVSDKTVINVHEKWILDSIFNNKRLNLDNYILKQNNVRKLKKDAENIKPIAVI